MKGSLSKLVMEFVGTFLLTLFFVGGGQNGILLGLWVVNIFFWKICGSHFNPAVTFAYIFRKDTEVKFSVSLALCYMVAQTLGAFVGALLLNFYTFELPALTFVSSFFLRALLQELFCTFIYVFFFMTNTDEKLLFSNEKAINCFILAASYVGARAMFAGNVATVSTYGAVMNPAIAMGIQMSSLLSDGFEAWEAIYLYPTVPFAASFLAVLFYELVYKKTQAFLAHEDDASDTSQNDDQMGEHD